MKRKPDPVELSPRSQLIKAFEDLEGPVMRADSQKREGILKNHRMQLRSAQVEAFDHPPAVMESSETFVIYAKLHLKKPLFRKLDLFAQLNDESLVDCIVGLLETEVEAVLSNTEELGSLLRKRILEEAHGTGSKSPGERQATVEQGEKTAE